METEKSLHSERLRRSTKHTVRFQHDKDKEKSLKGISGEDGQGLVGSGLLIKTSQFGTSD